MPSYNTTIVLIGAALLGAAAGAVGSFAVLRRRALTGDALAHATLPGVCLAFLLFGQRQLPVLLTGALFTGILGVAVISGLRRFTRVKEDAAIGLVLGVFFGAGIVLTRVVQNTATSGSKAGIDSFILGKTAGMTLADVTLIGGVAAVALLLVLLLYKEFKVTVFDANFAQAQGWPVFRLDLMVMALVAVVVVIGLPAVGVVLMAALLILPAAAARFWTERFGVLVIVSCAFGVAIGLCGTLLSASFERLPAGPMIVLTGSALFAVSALFAPRRGAIARALRHLQFRRDLRAGRITPPPEMKQSADLAASENTGGWNLESLPRRSETRELGAAKEGKVHPLSRAPSARLSVSPSLLLSLFIAAAFIVAPLAWWWTTLPPADHPLALWTMAVALLVNLPCALLGCFLVLRRMSLLGDAISHAVLPGIALAFLFTGQISGPWIIAGAAVLGVLTALAAQSLHQLGRVPEDSSLGIVYTTLFAAGVIMITKFAANTHLDADCVLYGLLDYVALDRISIGNIEVPSVLPTVLGTCLATIIFLKVFWKELKLSSFDAALATAMGLSAAVMQYLLLGMVAAVTVASFEAVGSILVVAMLIVPGATAHLLADRLGPMLIWSAAVAVVAAIGGYVFAQLTETNSSGMMAVVAGAQFGLAVFFSPRHGLVSKWWRNFSLALRIATEDIIALLYRAEEAHHRGERPLAWPSVAEAESAVYGLAGRLAVGHLRRRDELALTAEGRLRLTAAGRQRGREIVRSHRLWEAYLGEQSELPLDHLHAPAERMEHFIGRELQAQIAAEVTTGETDPHGREIP